MLKTYKANDFNLPEGVTLSDGKAVILAKRDDLRLHLPLNNDRTDISKYNIEPDDVWNADNFVDGKLDKALQLLYTNSYIKYPINAFADVFNEHQAFTVCFWINADRYSGRTQIILSHGYGTSETSAFFNIFMPYDRTYMKFSFNNNGTYRTDLQYNFNFATSGWKHIVLRYDGSKQYTPGHLDLFVDGVDMTSDSNTSLTDNLSNRTFHRADTPLTICNFNPAGGSNSNAFEGKLDDLRIYDTAISDTMISRIYNSGNGTEENFKQFGVYKLEQREYFKEPYLKTYNDFDPVCTGNIEYTFILPDEKEYYTDGTNLFSYDGTTRSSQAEITQYLTNLKEPFKLNVYMNYPNISSTVPEFTKYDIDYTIRVSKDFTITVDDDTQDKKTFQVGEKKLIKISYQFDDGTPVNIKDGDTINVAMVKNDTTVATWTKEDLLFEGLSTFYLQLDFSGLQIGSYYLVIEVKNGNTFTDISKNIIITLA